MSDTLPRIEQLTRDDLRGMTADQIIEATAAGRLDAVLGRPVRVDYKRLAAEAEAGGEHPITADELRHLDPTTIVRLHALGKLDHLLGVRR